MTQTCDSTESSFTVTVKLQELITILIHVHSSILFLQYFTSRLKDQPTELSSNQTLNETLEAGDTRNVLESKFNNVMTLCAMVPLLIFTCLNSFLHQRYTPCPTLTPTKIKLTLQVYTVYLAVLCLVCALLHPQEAMSEAPKGKINLVAQDITFKL